MKACFSTLGCPDWNIDQMLACVKDLGFEGIEIRGLEGEMFAPKSLHLQPGSRFLQELESLGCAVAGLGSSASFGKPAEALAECRAYVDAAAAIGCKLVRVFGGRLFEGMDHAEGATALPPLCVKRVSMRRRRASLSVSRPMTTGAGETNWR